MNPNTNLIYDLLYPIFKKQNVYKYLFELPDNNYKELINIFYKIHMRNRNNLHPIYIKAGTSKLPHIVISYLLNIRINKHLPEKATLDNYLISIPMDENDYYKIRYSFRIVLGFILHNLGKEYDKTIKIPTATLKEKYKDFSIKYYDYYLLKQTIIKKN